MKQYESLVLKIVFVKDDDIVRTSAGFTDEETGDNGVWFPGVRIGGDLQ